MINEKIVKTREHSKGSDGSYDTIYRETLAELVKDKDGKTAQEHIDASVNAGAHGMRYDNDRETIAIYNAETETWKETSAGRLMAGHDVEPEPGTVVTAGEGAEVFNDYSERLYDENGKPTQGNVASGIRAHAEGGCTTASGNDSHAEGWKTTASGKNSHAEGWGTTASGQNSHAEGYQTTASRQSSHAEGYLTAASGDYSHAEGYKTTASGLYSHAEGSSTTASGQNSHAEGSSTVASASYSYAEGAETTASGHGSHAEGYRTTASGQNSHAEGSSTVARGLYSHAAGFSTYVDAQYGGRAVGNGCIASTSNNVFKIKAVNPATKTLTIDPDAFSYTATQFAKIQAGHKLLAFDHYYINIRTTTFTVVSVNTTALTIVVEEDIATSNVRYKYLVCDQIRTTSSYPSFAEGCGSVASGDCSHAEGAETTASGLYSHAEGYKTTASGSVSHAEGNSTVASGYDSHAEGNSTVASGNYSHAEGWGTTASGWYSHAGGRYNVDNSSAYFIIGKGTGESTRANAFRITNTGTVYATGSYQTSGADYAEWFEWEDGNPDREDRRGLLVTMNGEKIRVANAKDEFILGVVSAFPGVIGNAFDDQWQGMYVTDIFGTPVVETVEHPDEIVHIGNEEDGETYTIPGYTADEWKLNPDYDSSQPYTPRSERNEWSAVGMVGQLVTIDDGTCEVNGWAKPADQGIVTTSDTRTKYRVIARIDETHVKLLVL